MQNAMPKQKTSWEIFTQGSQVPKWWGLLEKLVRFLIFALHVATGFLGWKLWHFANFKLFLLP